MTAPEPTPTADEHTRALRQAISDPGATTPPGDDYREQIVDWQLRAVLAQPEALAANLPADVMLDALVRAGVLRSPETVDPIAWTIHVEVPTDATEAEVDMLQDRVADAAYGMERGKWDPLVSAHTLDCVASDHCAAPRPDGPPYPKPEVAP